MVRLNATPRGGTDAGWAACFLGHLLGWPVDPVMVVPGVLGVTNPTIPCGLRPSGIMGHPVCLCFDWLAAEAVGAVVVDDTAGLHPDVDDDRADELEAAFFERSRN